MPFKFKLFFIFFLLLIFWANFSIAQRELEVPIPGIETIPTLPEFIRARFNFSIMLAGFVAFAVLIYAGLRYLTSTGDPAKMADARSQFYAGILGLFILFTSYLILVTINPQLVILKLPEIKKPEKIFIPKIKPFELPSIKYQEIPVGVLISSEVSENYFYSEYQGVLHRERLERILRVSELAKKVSEEIRRLSIILKNGADDCSCSRLDKGYCTSPGCGGGSCTSYCKNPCTGEPCSWRNEMEKKRGEIKVLAGAFEAFLESKVKDFINNNQNEINALPQDLRELIDEMKKVEEKYGNFKENKEGIGKELDKLKRAEKEIIACYGSPISYDELLNWKIDREGKVEVLKFEDVKIGEDPLTFYCGVR